MSKCYCVRVQSLSSIQVQVEVKVNFSQIQNLLKSERSDGFFSTSIPNVVELFIYSYIDLFINNYLAP